MYIPGYTPPYTPWVYPVHTRPTYRLHVSGPWYTLQDDDALGSKPRLITVMRGMRRIEASLLLRNETVLSAESFRSPWLIIKKDWIAIG